MNQDFAGTDLAVGTIRGLRSWNMDKAGRLTSLNNTARIWRPGENVAVCHACPCDPCARRRREGDRARVCSTQRRLGHYPGHPDCTCGFYAYHDGMSHADQTGCVAGMIEAYGRVTIGTKGFRAEKARIIALVAYLAGGVEGRLKHLYPDVPFFDDLAELLEQFPLSFEYVPGPDTDPDFWDPAPEPASATAAMWLAGVTNTVNGPWNIQPPAMPGTFGAFNVTFQHEVAKATEKLAESARRVAESMRLALGITEPDPKPGPESAAGHDWQALSWYGERVGG